MKLSKSDLLVISSIFNANLAMYDKRFRKIEKILSKLSKEKSVKCDEMTYDELAKNIVKLTGDEFYTRDFNIVRTP